MSSLTAKYMQILQGQIIVETADRLATAQRTLNDAREYTPLVLSMLASTKQSIQNSLNAINK